MTNLSSNVILCTATVVLDSSVGMRQACPAEMVTYTCTVNQGAQLDWIVEPFLPASAQIQFLATASTGSSIHCSDLTPPQCDNIDFVATLTNIANPMTIQGTTVADMASTLAISATVGLNGTVIQCKGTTADGTPIDNSTLRVTGMFMCYSCSRVSI